MTEHIAHPPIASRDEWQTARKQLLLKEKELTHQGDAVNVHPLFKRVA